jgi:hypothetical protein
MIISPRPFDWLGARLNALVNRAGAAGHRPVRATSAVS